MWVFGLLNPVTAMVSSAAITASLLATMTPKAKINMRKQVAEKFIPVIRNIPDEKEREIRKKVFNELNKLASAVDSGIKAMLDDLEYQLTSSKKELLENKYASITKYQNLLEKLISIKEQL